MAKKATAFFCKECGYESAKWFGQCPACKEWNTFVEEPVSAGKGVKGATIKAYVNGKQIGKSATVNSDGSFTLTIPKQKGGTEVVVKMSKSGYETKTKKLVVK